MRLAEALTIRADQQRRLAQLRDRIVKNARALEGQNPPENPSKLLDEHDRIAIEVEGLVQRINRTNATSEIAPGLTIADAIARRDRIATSRNLHVSLADSATEQPDSYSLREVRYVPTVDVAVHRKAADMLAKEYRELDLQVQAMNWSVDLK